MASEDVATRIGIGPNKPSVEQWENDEPVIWIGDEEISVFFVLKSSGQEIHAKFKVDATSITNQGKSAELVNDAPLGSLNGEYTIYAFTPYVAGSTLAQAQLNLANQTQAANTTTYSHLGKTASMRAAGVAATFENSSLVSGDVNFDFEHITSFLRFNITNSADETINVTGISLTHANLFSDAKYNVVTGVRSNGVLNSSIALSFDGSGKTLTNTAEFDAYMSTFPVSTNVSSTDKLGLTVYYTNSKGAQDKAFQISANQLIAAGVTELFPTGTRYLFDIDLASSGDDLDPSDRNVVLNGYEYSYMMVDSDVESLVYHEDEPFVSHADRPNACPDPWTFAPWSVFEIDGGDNNANISMLGANFGGFFDLYSNEMINMIYIVTYESISRVMQTHVNNKSGHPQPMWDTGRYRPICRRVIID